MTNEEAALILLGPQDLWQDLKRFINHKDRTNCCAMCLRSEILEYVEELEKKVKA